MSDDEPRCTTCGLPTHPDYGDPHECPPGFLTASPSVPTTQGECAACSHSAGHHRNYTGPCSFKNSCGCAKFSDSVPAPMVQVPAAKFEALRHEVQAMAGYLNDYGIDAAALDLVSSYAALVDAADTPRPTKRPCRESEHLWCDVEGRCLNCDAPKDAPAAPVGEPLPLSEKEMAEAFPKMRDAFKREHRWRMEVEAELAALKAPARVPVNDEAEAAWQEHSTNRPMLSGIGGADVRKAFLAGFRVARGENA